MDLAHAARLVRIQGGLHGRPLLQQQRQYARAALGDQDAGVDSVTRGVTSGVTGGSTRA
jgi:hypothetical protein